MNKRGSGILLHVTSLPSLYGIGDLGPWAYRFADFLEENEAELLADTSSEPHGARIRQLPYSSVSTLLEIPFS